MTDNHEDDREALRKIKVVFEKAVQANTIDDMRQHVDTHFSFVSFTDRLFEDFESFKQQWQKTRDEMVGNGSFSTELIPVPTQFHGDIAVCSGSANNTLLDKQGKQHMFTSNWTIVFKLKDQQWRVLRAHNSIDPFGNPMLLSGVKKQLVKFSSIAFIAGCSLASLLTFWFLT